MLWYLPFEALIPTGLTPETTLADRYARSLRPDGGPGGCQPLPLRRPQHTGILANEFKLTGDDAGPQAAVLQELENVVPGPIVLPNALPEPPHLMSPLLDGLIVLDESSAGSDAGNWSPLPQGRGAAEDAPKAGSVCRSAGRSKSCSRVSQRRPNKGSRRRVARAAIAPRRDRASEIFQSLCGMMASGARTVLLTRWRTGGRTNFDLVREFAKELPQCAGRRSLAARTCVLRAKRRSIPRTNRGSRNLTKSGDMPTADHPFFWAGYLLVDTGPRPENAIAKLDDGGKPAAKDAREGSDAGRKTDAAES